MVLLADGSLCAFEPGFVIVWRVAGRGIGGVGKRGVTVSPRKGAEVIVKRMILFDDDNYMLDRIIRFHFSPFLKQLLPLLAADRPHVAGKL